MRNLSAEPGQRYPATGFGSLQKIEIDLLILVLICGPWKSLRDQNKSQQDLTQESIFELAQKLKISPRRLRLRLDMLAFRQPTENPQEKIPELLRNEGEQNDGNVGEDAK